MQIHELGSRFTRCLVGSSASRTTMYRRVQEMGYMHHITCVKSLLYLKKYVLMKKKNLDCLHSFLHVMNVTEYIPIMQASLATRSVIMIDLWQIYEWFNVSEKLQKELQFHQSLENLWASWKKFTKQTRPCKEQLSLSHVQ